MDRRRPRRDVVGNPVLATTRSLPARAWGRPAEGLVLDLPRLVIVQRHVLRLRAADRVLPDRGQEAAVAFLGCLALTRR